MFCLLCWWSIHDFFCLAVVVLLLFLLNSAALQFLSVLGFSCIVQVGMNGDTFSIKAPKECSKKFAATFKGKFLTRRNVLRIFFLFLEDVGVPL